MDLERWPYSWFFVGCCFQGLFIIAHSIFVQWPSSVLPARLVIHIVYNTIWYDVAWKKLRFILLDKSDFHMTNNLSIADNAFALYIHTYKNTHTHTHTLTETRGKRWEWIKQVINKITKDLHRQSTPMGQLQTQKLEANKIKTTYQSNLFYKGNLTLSQNSWYATWKRYEDWNIRNMPGRSIWNKNFFKNRRQIWNHLRTYSF